MRGIFERNKRPAVASAHHGAPGSSSGQRDSELRGSVFLVGSHSVTVERKLAEGGFAIVYLVRDNREPRHRYALKRQFTNDAKQLSACKREIEIIKTLNHRNIVRYVDSCVVKRSDDVFETNLLTQFYRHSVLELLNQRLMNGKWLRSREEVLRIFCDICEAVARLHHSQTPVIHRDLKVENILIDEDGTFVLCDFGSATTKTLAAGGGGKDAAVVEEEILRFTTLSYRAPEMVDLYAGTAMTTKVDMWALGVLLFKLAYFQLPFGESALAIQNATFSFPPEPPREPELKALIRYLLEPDPLIRPDIFQASAIAFHLRGRALPVPNLHNAPVKNLRSLLGLLGEGDAPAEAKRDSPATVRSPVVSPALVETGTPPRSDSVTRTTVAPRLRPKAAGAATPGGVLPLPPTALPESSSDPDFQDRYPGGASFLPPSKSLHQVSSPSDLGFQDLEDAFVPSSSGSGDPSSVLSPEEEAMSALQISASAPHLPPGKEEGRGTVPRAMTASYHQGASSVGPASGARFVPGHRRNVSDTSAVFGSGHPSAFRPYRSSQPDGLDSTGPPPGLVIPPRRSKAPALPRPPPKDAQLISVEPSPASGFNPFSGAPGFSVTVDDAAFGEVFDRLPRRRGSKSSTSNVKSSESLVMAEADPFGAAPFNPKPSRAAAAAAAAAAPPKSFHPTDLGLGGVCSSDDDDEAPLALSTPSDIVSPRTDEASVEGGPSGGGGGALRSLATSMKSKRYKQLIDDDEAEEGEAKTTARLRVPQGDDECDSVGSASDLRLRMQADTSEDESAAEEEEASSLDHTERRPVSATAAPETSTMGQSEGSARLPYDQLSSEGGLSGDEVERREPSHSDCEERAEMGLVFDSDQPDGDCPLLDDHDDEAEPEHESPPIVAAVPNSDSTSTITSPDTASTATIVPAPPPSVPRMAADPFMAAPLRAGSQTPTSEVPTFSLPPREDPSPVIAPPKPPPPPTQPAVPGPPVLPPSSSVMRPAAQSSPSVPRLPPPLAPAPRVPLRSPLSPPSMGPPAPLRPRVLPSQPRSEEEEEEEEEDGLSLNSAGSKVRGRYKKGGGSAEAGEDELVLTSKNPDTKASKKAAKEPKTAQYASTGSLASKQSKKSKKSTKSGELSFVNSSFQAEDWDGTSESGASNI